MAGSAPEYAAGRRGVVLTTAALVAACLVILNTGVQILPDDPLVPGVPLLNVLTLQRLLVLAGLVALAIAAPRPSTFTTVVDIPVLALVALAAGSLLQADQPFADWRRLLTAVAVMYLIVGVIRRHRGAGPLLMLTVLAAAFVAGATGVQQFSQGVETGFCRSGWTNTEECAAGDLLRATGTFSNPNLLAGYLIMAVPLTIGLIRHSASRSLRTACWVLGAVATVGLVVTFSRAAMFALLVVGIGVLVLLAARRWGPAGAAVPAAVAAGVLLVTVLLATLVTGAFARATGRGELWDTALAAARRGGIDGVGYGRAGDVMRGAGGDVAYSHAHNLWLNWLIDVGPFGPVVITALLALAIVAGARRAAAGSLLAAGAVAALAAVSIASLTDHPTTIARNLLLLFVVIACAVAEPAPRAAPMGRHAGDSLVGNAMPQPRRSAEGAPEAQADDTTGAIPTVGRVTPDGQPASGPGPDTAAIPLRLRR